MKILKIKCENKVRVNNTYIEFLYVKDDDILYLLKESLNKNFRYTVIKKLENIDTVSRDFIKEIAPAIDETFKAKKVFNALCRPNTVFEVLVKDSYKPCFNIVGYSENGVLVTVNQYYEYKFENDNLVVK